MKGFREGFHRFLVGITLITGSMQIGVFLSEIVKDLVLFFWEKNTPDYVSFIIFVITFMYVTKKTTYYTEFKYKKGE